MGWRRKPKAVLSSGWEFNEKGGLQNQTGLCKAGRKGSRSQEVGGGGQDQAAPGPWEGGFVEDRTGG